MNQERLKELLEYNPATGDFIWKPPHRYAGRSAIAKIGRGYRSVTVAGVQYYAHRLAFLYMTGVDADYVDHVNGIKHDNSWINLRNATNGQNLVRAAYARNRELPRGVSKTANGMKYRARVGPFEVGRFDTVEEAKTVYDIYAKEFYGEFFDGPA